MDKTRVMENVNLLTQKHLFITTTDKHGVPPTKRLFRVPTLDPSPEFIGPWGTFGDPGQPRKYLDNSEWSRPTGFQFARENLQSRVEKENTITNVENAVFDLSIVLDYAIRNAVLNEWVLDSFDIKVDYGKMRDNPYSRRREEEQWESGVEKTEYEPPFVGIETLEIKRYSFKGGKRFVCVTKQLDDALPLGRVNGSRFIGMIRKEMDEE
ncbi:hypothetical protein Tco_1354836 [Tanacetum coccineum]